MKRKLGRRLEKGDGERMRMRCLSERRGGIDRGFINTWAEGSRAFSIGWAFGGLR